MRSVCSKESKNFLPRYISRMDGFVNGEKWGKVCWVAKKNSGEEAEMGSRKFWIFGAAVLALACYLAACGGSGSAITPPPPAGNFSNASLNGQYAFSMSGADLTSGALTIGRTAGVTPTNALKFQFRVEYQ